MTKKELVDALAKDAGLTKAAADKVLDSVISNITNALKKDDKISLIGFGTFSVTTRAARQGRNPQTGKPMKIAAKKVAKFKPGKTLVDTVNGVGKKK